MPKHLHLTHPRLDFWVTVEIWERDGHLTRRCQQSRADGSPCGAPPSKDGRYCFAHDPARSDEMAAARRLSGERQRRERVVSGVYDPSGLRDIDGIRRLLDVVVVDTLGLENSIARSRTLITAAMAATKLLEVEATFSPPIVIEAGERAADEGAGD